MAKANRIDPPPAPPAKVILELDEVEALHLRSLTGRLAPKSADAQPQEDRYSNSSIFDALNSVLPERKASNFGSTIWQ